MDYSEVEATALALGAAADQVPFAMAIALNRAADVTRNFLAKATWPQHVNARNGSFIMASLTTKESRASKQSLAVEIYDKLDRGNLLKQAMGGTRAPMGGSNLAVPASTISRTQSGVPARFRPKNMPTAVRKGDVLYSRDRKGRLTLLYVLKPKTNIPKRVPFHDDFATSMLRELARTMPLAIERAMRTRR
jgi:hypothetical protein